MTDESLGTTAAQQSDTIPDAFTGDPVKSREAVSDIKFTNQLQDFSDAIKHTHPDDIDLESPVREETDDGVTIREPSWTDDKHEQDLIELDTEWVYANGMVRLDALQVVALEEGLIEDVSAYPVRGDFHWAVKALRRRGAPIPKYEWDPTVAVLPPTTGHTSPEISKATEVSSTELTMQRARDRCQARIVNAIRSGEPALIEALPTLGKSFGTPLATSNTSEPITLVTCRGHKEQYEQYEEWCTEHDLSHRRLPSFFRECPTAPTGTPETEIEEQIRDLYQRGAGPQELHKRAVEVFGQLLPCQQGSECPYMSAWDFEPSDYDVLLGYYTHAHVPLAIQGRTVIVDEFPGGAFETTLDETLSTAVTHFLQSYEEIPFETLTDLIENRDDRERRETALEWFESPDDSYGDTVFEDDDAHATAPLGVLTLLTATDLGNGWEEACPLGTDEQAFARVGVFDRGEETVYLLRPPDLTPARNVIALDGTPTPEMWNLAIGIPLEERHVLSQAEKQTYIRDVLQHRYIQTSKKRKAYNQDVTLQKDSALLTGIAQRHGANPGLLTTKTAEEKYKQVGLLDLVADHKHYGNLIGSNRFKHCRLGAVIGSNHYGDTFVEKWSAYAGVAAEREGEGAELTYGEFPDKFLRHMEHNTLQAVMRFGRDGNGATVYVHTNTLPDWVPIADEGRLIEAWSQGAKQVIEVAAEMESWRTADLAEYPEIGVGKRQIRNILTDLTDQGYVERSQEGRGYLWQNAGLEKAIDERTIDVSEVPEMSSTSIYRWDFRNSG